MFIYNPNKTKIWETVYVHPVENVENGEMFGMLCKRPYEKPILVKFEKRDTFTDLVEKKSWRKNQIRKLN